MSHILNIAGGGRYHNNNAFQQEQTLQQEEEEEEEEDAEQARATHADRMILIWLICTKSQCVVDRLSKC
jgi:hypothetical protein